MKNTTSYWSNSGKENSSKRWSPPRNSAVQLAAAITACARIYMYPLISRDDCYYTDTDSVVLGQPLPEDLISSSDLGKLKLEEKMEKGDFLAAKSYYYQKEDGKDVVKHKGPAKAYVSGEWFEKIYQDFTMEEKVMVSSNFGVDFKSMHVIRKDLLFNLGIKVDTKRKPLYLGDIWVDTEPFHISELGALNSMSQILRKSLMKQKNLVNVEYNKIKMGEKYKNDKDDNEEIRKGKKHGLTMG